MWRQNADLDYTAAVDLGEALVALALGLILFTYCYLIHDVHET